MTLMVKIDQDDFENLQRDNEMLHAENALKLKQILDLEQLLWDIRMMDDKDGLPCWMSDCHFRHDGLDIHGELCIKARQATEPFWKHSNGQE